MGRVPAAGVAIRSAPHRHRSDQSEPDLLQWRYSRPPRLRGGAAVTTSASSLRAQRSNPRAADGLLRRLRLLAMTKPLGLLPRVAKTVCPFFSGGDSPWMRLRGLPGWAG